MQQYDAVLKILLQASADTILGRLAGLKVVTWLNPEIPNVQISRADLVGETTDGRLVHVELQSTNDPRMALRMAEYALQIYRQFGRYPKQIALYVGESRMRMRDSLGEAELNSRDLTFQYKLMDIREIDGTSLLASSHIGDNLFAILTNLPDEIGTLRQILLRIADLKEEARGDAFAQFLVISGLRRLEPIVRQEAEKMPILNDIMEHQVIGPAILEGLEKGREEGLQQGRRQGQKEIVLRLLAKRFSAAPAWVGPKLDDMSAEQLDDLAVRILDADRLEELF